MLVEVNVLEEFWFIEIEEKYLGINYVVVGYFLVCCWYLLVDVVEVVLYYYDYLVFGELGWVFDVVCGLIVVFVLVEYIICLYI